MTYKDYSEKVQKYMKKMESTLKKEQGGISEATEVNLDILAANLEIYFDLLEQIKKDGVVRMGKEKQVVRHPALASLNTQNVLISKLISSLGLTPMSKSKLKITNDDAEDELDELIDE